MSCWRDLGTQPGESHNFTWVAKCAAFLATAVARNAAHVQVMILQCAKHVPCMHGTCFAHWSIWSDPSEATGQSWQIQQLFLHRSCVTQESCGTEMTHYTKKHVVDYCSACGVVHVVVQCALHYKYLQEKCVSAERWDINTTSAKQTNAGTLEVMTNK